jgi:MFS family permease
LYTDGWVDNGDTDSVAVNTQLFTIIPYACAFVMVLAFGYLSDRVNRKMPFLMLSFVLGCVGYVLLLASHNQAVSIFSTCLITASCYSAILLTPVWVNINTVGFTKRGATWAFTEAFGLTFSIMGTRIYDTPPQFVKGHSVVLSLNILACFSVLAAYFYMRRLNRIKERLNSENDDRGQTHPYASQQTLHEAGEAYASFKYIL